MSTAIQILRGEIGKYEEAQRVEDRYSAYPEYRGPNVAYMPIISELEQAVKRLESAELAATDSQQTNNAIALWEEAIESWQKEDFVKWFKNNFYRINEVIA